MERTGALVEPISPELVLVDEDLAVHARTALPDPPWVLSAVAEARQRVEVAPALAVEEGPAPKLSRRRSWPPFARHLRATAVFGCAVVALVAILSLTLELVPGSAKPTLATRRAAPAAPAAPKKSTSEHAVRRPKVQGARERKSKPISTRSPERSVPRHAAKATARAAVRVNRVLSWRLYRGAVYYQVHLRQGAKTIYEVRTLKRTASIRLRLRPGRYHAVVRPAVPSDAGIILGPAIMDKIVRV
ncbi:MAG TPA: hypothetical protein VKB73_01740 [Gaiellaceae bacterium]|nr:hypothetical protein [Gaiellaceae bacterium]